MKQIEKTEDVKQTEDITDCLSYINKKFKVILICEYYDNIPIGSSKIEELKKIKDLKNSLKFMGDLLDMSVFQKGNICIFINQYSSMDNIPWISIDEIFNGVREIRNILQKKKSNFQHSYMQDKKIISPMFEGLFKSLSLKERDAFFKNQKIYRGDLSAPAKVYCDRIMWFFCADPYIDILDRINKEMPFLLKNPAKFRLYNINSHDQIEISTNGANKKIVLVDEIYNPSGILDQDKFNRRAQDPIADIQDTTFNFDTLAILSENLSSIKINCSIEKNISEYPIKVFGLSTSGISSVLKSICQIYNLNLQSNLNGSYRISKKKINFEIETPNDLANAIRIVIRPDILRKTEMVLKSGSNNPLWELCFKSLKKNYQSSSKIQKTNTPLLDLEDKHIQRLISWFMISGVSLPDFNVMSGTGWLSYLTISDMSKATNYSISGQLYKSDKDSIKRLRFGMSGYDGEGNLVGNVGISNVRIYE